MPLNQDPSSKNKGITNILIADDHSMIREGLITLLSNLLPHIKIDEAWDGDSAYEKIKHNDYRLVILDVHMPDTDPFGLVRNIHVIKPETNILIFSMNREDMYAKKFFQLGVKGYLNKDAATEEIKKAVLKILDNKKYFSEELRDALTEEALGKHPENLFANLSVREFEIFQYLIKGEPMSQISHLLNIHTSTLGTHKKRILDKLKCKNIMELSELAKINDIIP